MCTWNIQIKTKLCAVNLKRDDTILRIRTTTRNNDNKNGKNGDFITLNLWLIAVIMLNGMLHILACSGLKKICLSIPWGQITNEVHNHTRFCNIFIDLNSFRLNFIGLNFHWFGKKLEEYWIFEKLFSHWCTL